MENQNQNVCLSILRTLFRINASDIMDLDIDRGHENCSGLNEVSLTAEDGIRCVQMLNVSHFTILWLLYFHIALLGKFPIEILENPPHMFLVKKDLWIINWMECKTFREDSIDIFKAAVVAIRNKGHETEVIHNQCLLCICVNWISYCQFHKGGISSALDDIYSTLSKESLNTSHGIQIIADIVSFVIYFFIIFISCLSVFRNGQRKNDDDFSYRLVLLYSCDSSDDGKCRGPSSVNFKNNRHFNIFALEYHSKNLLESKQPISLYLDSFELCAIHVWPRLIITCK